MRLRFEIHAEFVARFHLGERPTPATVEELEALETELGSKLPIAFREFMTGYGAVYTPGILDEISDKQIEHTDIQNVLDIQEAIDGTKLYWSAGMPEDVIGVMSDCMGNLIGFRRQIENRDDASIVLFDHDFVEVHDIAPSFDEFLNWYLDNLTGQRTSDS